MKQIFDNRAQPNDRLIWKSFVAAVACLAAGLSQTAYSEGGGIVTDSSSVTIPPPSE